MTTEEKECKIRQALGKHRGDCAWCTRKDTLARIAEMAAEIMICTAGRPIKREWALANSIYVACKEKK